MKELGIMMDFGSQANNYWWDHIPNDNINHLQGTSTLRVQKLNYSLAKEPISTHAKCATQTLDANYKKSRFQLNCQKQLQASKYQSSKK